MPHLMNTKSTRPKNKKRPKHLSNLTWSEALTYLNDLSYDLFHESVREMILEPETGLYQMLKKKETT